MLTLKQPSPLVKPATHWGCGLVLSSGKIGLGIAIVLVKASLSKVLKPLLIEALRFIIFCREAPLQLLNVPYVASS